MSERFTLDVRMDMPKLLIDKNTNEKYNLLMVNDIERIVDVLNEQQARIELLEDNCLAYNLTRKHLEGIINEQQATIRRLQDLCGQSDSENAKLRIENKRLQKELNDCEKFRYQVFKRMGELNDE